MVHHSHKKPLFHGAVAFVATLIVGIGIGYLYRMRYSSPTVRIPNGGQDIVINTDKTLDIAQDDLAPVDPDSTLAIAQQKILYERVIKQYRYRSIHVGADCRAVPNAITVAGGSRIMLDNQSDQEKIITVSFDSEGFILNPHHYAITNVPNKGVFTVDCDNQKNVATITIKG